MISLFKEYDSDYGRSKKRGGKSKSKPSTSSKSKSKKKKRARVNYDSHLEDESEEDEVIVLSYDLEEKFVDSSFTLQDFEALTSWSKKKKDKLVESAASRSKRKPKNDYSWVESDMSEDEASVCFKDHDDFVLFSYVSGLNPVRPLIPTINFR